LSAKTFIRRPAVSLVSTFLKLSLLVLALPAIARAQCEKKETTVELVDCWNAEWKKADAELNRVYQAAIKKQRPPNAAKLRRAQRAWIAYRDAQCEAEGSVYEGGTIQPMIVGHCMLTLTQQRTKHILEAYPVK
jgi:uncharacterized protein YecT (DUF1311 family)